MVQEVDSFGELDRDEHVISSELVFCALQRSKLDHLLFLAG